MAPQRRRRGYATPLRPRRNTAPLWKKVTIVLSATIAAVLLMSVLDSAHVSFLVLLVAVLAVVAAVVWLMAKLLGVRLSLHSWD
jgi:antibiotic biosynthesis monooxygenase (ABM) superfamily enzyme